MIKRPVKKVAGATNVKKTVVKPIAKTKTKVENIEEEIDEDSAIDEDEDDSEDEEVIIPKKAIKKSVKKSIPDDEDDEDSDDEDDEDDEDSDDEDSDDEDSDDEDDDEDSDDEDDDDDDDEDSDDEDDDDEDSDDEDDEDSDDEDDEDEDDDDVPKKVVKKPTKKSSPVKSKVVSKSSTTSTKKEETPKKKSGKSIRLNKTKSKKSSEIPVQGTFLKDNALAYIKEKVSELIIEKDYLNTKTEGFTVEDIYNNTTLNFASGLFDIFSNLLNECLSNNTKITIGNVRFNRRPIKARVFSGVNGSSPTYVGPHYVMTSRTSGQEKSIPVKKTKKGMEIILDGKKVILTEEKLEEINEAFFNNED